VKDGKPSITARHVALTRASFERPSTTTGDPEAETRLYRSLGSSHLPRGSGETRRMQRRTAFFDSETLGAIGRGTQQIVIVGAGYDGRALRFATPGLRWFEVDHPDTQADKLRRLASAGVDARDIVFVSVDLTTDDLRLKLSIAGHDPTKPTLFVVEGLIGYLPETVTRRLLLSLRELAAGGSRLAIAIPTFPRNARRSELFRLRLRAKLVSLIGEPWLVRYQPDEPDELLRSTGWAIGAWDRASRAPARFEGRNGVLVGAEPAPAPS
jgi:methyltransferase (TIGR00027 family)